MQSNIIVMTVIQSAAGFFVFAYVSYIYCSVLR